MICKTLIKDNRMNSTIKILACATTVVAAVCGTAIASPRAAEASGANFLIAAEDFEGFHLGTYYRWNSRETANHQDLSNDSFAVTVGYNVLDWLSLYVLGGTADVNPPNAFGDRGTAFLYGIGAWANLIDHDIISNLSCETRMRLTASAQVSAASPEIGNEDYDYTETFASLTLSIINDLVGNKNIWPESIGIFVGPVFNKYDCDKVKTVGDEIGFMMGLDVFVSDRVGLSAAYETYNGEDEAITFSLNYSF